MESSEWPEVGLLFGHTVQLGGYTECLKAQASRFRGKYCMVGMKIFVSQPKIPESVLRPASKWAEWPNGNTSVWDVIAEVRI